MDKINDCRTEKDFRLITFSGYQKTKVRDELLKSMRDRKIEPACYWTVEMVASGHFQELWEAFFQFFAQYIHLGNVKLVVYLRERYGIFYRIVNSHTSVTGSDISPLELRNMPKIRTLFAEIVALLTLSLRKPALNRMLLPSALHLATDGTAALDTKMTPLRDKSLDINVGHLDLPDDRTTQTIEKITKKKSSEKKLYLFHSGFMMERVAAPNTRFYAWKRKDDPDEWFVAMNEIAFHLSAEQHNMLDACFWIEWMLEYDAYCRTHSKEWAAVNVGSKDINKGSNRGTEYASLVNTKCQCDMVWAIWEVLLNAPRANGLSETIDKYIQTAHVLFCAYYTTASCTRKRFWLYFAVLLVTDGKHIDFSTQTIFQPEYREMIQNIIQNTDVIYRDLKALEKHAQTDYLMNGIRERDEEQNRLKPAYDRQALEAVDYFQMGHYQKKGKN